MAGANGKVGGEDAVPDRKVEVDARDDVAAEEQVSETPISWREAAMTLLGVSEWEDLDEEVAERLEDYLVRPLPLNTASLTVMQESGLLSFYQCAVVEEWRIQNGDILSFEELAMLDGFSHETAQALRPFISLVSSALPGRSSIPSARSRHSLSWRASGELARETDVASGASGGLVPAGVSSSGGASGGAGGTSGGAGGALGKGSLRVATGLKYAMDWSGRLQCGLGGSVTLPFVPQAGTVTSGGGGTSASSAGGTSSSAGVSAASSSGGGLALSKFSWDARALHPYIRWCGQKWLGQVLVGDYQLRFSQGLCLWSGFSLGGFSTPESFVRRPTGISPYGSFSQTPALRGAAAQFQWNAFRLSVAANVSNLLHSGRLSLTDDFLAAELNWHTRKGYLSLTGVTTGKVSLGGHFCWGGFDVFGEACFDGGAGLQALSERLLPGASTGSSAPAAAGGAKPAWAALAGTRLPLAEALKMSLSLRYYSPDFTPTNTGAVRAGTQCANEAGAALGLQWKAGRKATLTTSLDACLHPRTRDASRKHTAQIKSQLDGVYTPNKEWSLQGRATARLRNYDRRQKYDAKLSAAWQPAFLRWHTPPNKSTSSLQLSSASSFPNADSHPEAANPVSSSSCFPVTPSARGSISPSPESPYLYYIQANGGIALCHCTSFGVLLHLEESLHTPWGSVYLQEGWHRAPQWDDRLYLYERNAPGTFRVPARYGQGWFLHLYFSGLIPRAVHTSSSGSSVAPAASASSTALTATSANSSASTSAFHFAPRFKYYIGLDYQDFTYKSTRHQTLTLRLQLNVDF